MGHVEVVGEDFLVVLGLLLGYLLEDFFVVFGGWEGCGLVFVVEVGWDDEGKCYAIFAGSCSSSDAVSVGCWGSR